MTSPIEPIEPDGNPKFLDHQKEVIESSLQNTLSESDERYTKQDGNSHSWDPNNSIRQTTSKHRPKHLCIPKIHLRNFRSFHHISPRNTPRCRSSTVTVPTTSTCSDTDPYEW